MAFSTINQTITSDTILTFEFDSSIEGEVHGIGFDTDNDLAGSFLSELDGTNGIRLDGVGPGHQLGSDVSGAADFTADGREGSLTLTGVDLSNRSLEELLEDGTLWIA